MPAESCYTAPNMGSNGQPDYADAARLAHTLGKPVMTAAEREKQRAAYIAAVDGMATTLRQTVAAVERDGAVGRETWNRCDGLAARCERLERDAAVGRAFRSASFMARLRWLLTGL